MNFFPLHCFGIFFLVTVCICCIYWVGLGFKKGKQKMTSKDILEILTNSSEALSHASYCSITGSPVNGFEIEKAWKPLRELILKIKPDNMFIEPDSPEWVKPSIKIEEI